MTDNTQRNCACQSMLKLKVVKHYKNYSDKESVKEFFLAVAELSRPEKLIIL